MAQSSIVHLPTTHIQPNPLQPRVQMNTDDLNELVESIRLHGILEPLVIAHTPAGYQIIAGERRWKAAKAAGIKEVPCIIKETTPKGMLEMAIIENVQRVDLHPIDRAKAIQRLLNEFKLTVGQIAERLAKSQAYVSNSLRLLVLPDALKDGLLSGTITEGHARALASIPDQRLMVEAYKILLKESGSVRRAEELARRMKTHMNLPGGPTKAQNIVSDEIETWQSSLQEHFGKRSKVKLQRSRSQTKLTIILKGPPDETQPQLDQILELANLPPATPKPTEQVVFESTEIIMSG